MAVHLLPEEMLDRIFQFLSRDELKIVVLVCRRWRDTGEAPHFWAWVRLAVSQANLLALLQILRSRRFSGMTSIDLQVVSNPLCNLLLDLPGLREVATTWQTSGLASVGPRLLAQLLCRCQAPPTHPRVERAHLAGTKLPQQQASVLCAIIVESGEPSRTRLTPDIETT